MKIPNYLNREVTMKPRRNKVDELIRMSQSVDHRQQWDASQWNDSLGDSVSLSIDSDEGQSRNNQSMHIIPKPIFGSSSKVLSPHLTNQLNRRSNVSVESNFQDD